MKSKLRRNLVSIALLLATLILQPATAFGQGSAFTYQGFLTLNGTPANAANDFIFALFNASSGGAQAGSTVQTNGVGVTNGLFTVALDFGSAPFDGTALWLQIATRPAGAAAFTNVVPRQPIAATPYATFAGGVNAAGISNGSITASKLATGAAASNLQASGQSIVPSGGVILASNSSDASLVGAGYQSFGKVEIGVGWQQKSSAPLAGRYSATAVWTGNEMIVWGGFGGTAALLTYGGRFSPASNSWTFTTTNAAPSRRINHTAVWTGSNMIIWGGYYPTVSNDGGRYSPSSDSWTPTTTNGAPSGRQSHTAVWTGTEMIVWGGVTTNDVNDGARYNPATDTWTAITTNGAPAPRNSHTAVWTGTEMIVWGGYSDTNYFNDGARYNPTSNTWTAIPTNGAPAGRAYHTGVWTGTEMIVWGGYSYDGANHDFNDGGRYNPTANTWSGSFASTPLAGRSYATAVWTGGEMMVWGGLNQNGTYFNDGARYSPASNGWTTVSTAGGPTARAYHTAVWTDTDMIVWGGQTISSAVVDTFSYTPTRFLYLYLRP